MVDISCWFWFMFPWWLAMLSIFACTCWPYVCLLWTNVYSSHQPVLRVLFLVQFFLIWTNSYILLHLAHFCSELVFWFKVFFSYHQVTVSVCMVSRIWLFMIPWTETCQAPLFMEFSRQEYWTELPILTSGDLPDLGIKSISPATPALTGRFFTSEKPHHIFFNLVIFFEYWIEWTLRLFYTLTPYWPCCLQISSLIH